MPWKNQFFSRLKSALCDFHACICGPHDNLWSREDEYYHYCHFTFQHREAWGDKLIGETGIGSEWRHQHINSWSGSFPWYLLNG